MQPQMVVVRPLMPSLACVDDEVERTFFWNDFLDACHSTRKDRFPGCNPVSLSRQTLSQLGDRNYGIALKSDGVRFSLFLTMRQGSTPDQPKPVALMINRAGDMFEVEVIAVVDAFDKKTVLEGELVWKQPTEEVMLFLVFDCLRNAGEVLIDRPFHERYATAERLTYFSEELSSADDVEQRVDETLSVVLTQYTPKIQMRAKVFVGLEHAVTMWKQRGEIDHRVDGIIVQDYDSKYRFGTAVGGAILKWKAHATLDLQGGSEGQGAKPAASDGALPAAVEGRRLVFRNDSRIRPAAPESIIEYLVACDDCTVSFFAVRVRDDKSAPNSLAVCLATINDVLDDIQPSDLAACQNRRG